MISIPHTIHPSFVLQVTCPSRQEFTADRSAQWDVLRRHLCGSLEAKQSLLHGNPETAFYQKFSPSFFKPVQRGGLTAIQPRYGWTHVQIPGLCCVVFTVWWIMRSIKSCICSLDIGIVDLYCTSRCSAVCLWQKVGSVLTLDFVGTPLKDFSC